MPTTPKVIKNVIYGKDEPRLGEYGSFIQLSYSIKAWLLFYSPSFQILNQSCDGSGLAMEIEFISEDDANLFLKNWEPEVWHTTDMGLEQFTLDQYTQGHTVESLPSVVQPTEPIETQSRTWLQIAQKVLPLLGLASAR